MNGVHTAYYLVHSMGTSQGFEETDRRAAGCFAAAARAEGIRRIIYLGGLGDRSVKLSPHLRSRQEVGEILRQSGVPVIEFRASIVIGSGSLSFEMIRALVERLPVMITPRWVTILAQPIAIDDVLQYLRAALDVPARWFADIRNWRPGPRILRRIDARVCASARSAPPHDSRSRADSPALEPVAGSGHAALCPHRPQADRQHPSSDGCAG